MRRVLVTGSGGFIGSHLVNRLVDEGNYVVGVDLKFPEFQDTRAQEFYQLDLRDQGDAWKAVNISKPDDVYQLACDMGGIGYITQHLADIARNNILINVNMLDAAVAGRTKRYLYTSSACVYNQDLQSDADVKPLKEEDAWPALPERGYGLEKLFAEEMCDYYRKDYGLDIRVVRFHNVYGAFGTYDGGKEKSPAALCRKIAGAQDGIGIEIWGDGEQTRSYMSIADCVEGIRRIMESGYQKPINLGTDELVSINELASKICRIAGKTLQFHHDLSKPQGVRGRNSDNSLLREILKWEPKISLDEGLKSTYAWINKQVNG